MSLLNPDEFKRLKKQDPEVIDKLYRLTKDKIYSFIMMKLKGNRTAAEEVFSDTIHSILVSLPKLKSDKNIFSWMVQIAYRRMCDYLNKVNRDLSILEESDQEFESKNDVVEEMIHKEKIVQFNIGLDRIKPKYKEILTWKYLEKLSQKELALKLNKNEKAVESLLIRAKTALRKELLNCEKQFFT